MCRPVPCPTCHKTTWSGCGQHIEQVKASVPDDRWCTCGPAAPAEKAGFLSGLLGRQASTAAPVTPVHVRLSRQ